MKSNSLDQMIGNFSGKSRIIKIFLSLTNRVKERLYKFKLVKYVFKLPIIKKYLVKLTNSEENITRSELLDLIKIVRDTDINKIPLHDLRDVLIPKLGLNNENLEEQPVEIINNYIGKGLRIWQYPNQFAKLLRLLNETTCPRPIGYLEIGSRWCGTFIVMSELLFKRSPDKEFTVIACDLIDEPKILKVYRELCVEIGGPKVLYFQGDSREPTLRQLAETECINTVFIDGDHSTEGALSDYLQFRELSNMMILHDIDSDAVPNLRRVWSIIKDLETNSIIHEFNDQYDSVKGNFLGIGVVIKSGVKN